MRSVWTIAETHEGQTKKVSFELITAAHELAEGGPVTAVVVGPGLGDAATALAEAGASLVLHLDDTRLEAFSADGWAGALAALVRDRSPDVVLGAATFRGRDLTARLAAELGQGIAQDATDVSVADSSIAATRPIYAGKAMATVAVAGKPAILTIRPNSYPAASGPGGGTVETVTPSDYTASAVVTALESSQSKRPDVSEADIIVSGGRGMGGPEHFTLIEELADSIGAAVGASRAVVDAGWRPHSEQVGQTGKTVSPSLYIACGISGAVQHLAGMKTAKYIVAINKDPEAPIFDVADYGIVGDVFEVVPALARAFRELKATQ